MQASEVVETVEAVEAVAVAVVVVVVALESVEEVAEVLSFFTGSTQSLVHTSLAQEFVHSSKSWWLTPASAMLKPVSIYLKY